MLGCVWSERDAHAGLLQVVLVEVVLVEPLLSSCDGWWGGPLPGAGGSGGSAAL